MRIGNRAGRAVLLDDERAVDIAHHSGGLFGPDPQQVYRDWDRFRDWAARVDVARDGQPYRPGELLAPVPRPGQIFAIGLNYREHAAEVGRSPSDVPLVFTKFLSSLTGPTGTIDLPDGTVDWEAEIVAVIGREGKDVARADAWDVIAGLMLGQDLSERRLQRAGSQPQFSLGKSFTGFAPTGPFVATTDEFADPENISFGCTLDGEKMQHGSTAQMIFDVGELIETISAVLTLMPGDLLFTGTPPGVGAGRTPPVYLRPGQELVTFGDRLGEMRHRFA